jgi:hypothetical protein
MLPKIPMVPVFGLMTTLAAIKNTMLAEHLAMLGILES